MRIYRIDLVIGGGRSHLQLQHDHERRVFIVHCFECCVYIVSCGSAVTRRGEI
jgi:hypothetical protein